MALLIATPCFVACNDDDDDDEENVQLSGDSERMTVGDEGNAVEASN